MESHPIPQQISSYQFRLVGDMTLKQFFQLGGGALVAILIYATNLYPLIKWPLILISVSLGAALAFLPFEERPLSHWITAFFRSVYAPTVYIWQKEVCYQFFQEETASTPAQATPTEKQLEEYLQKVPNEAEGSVSKLESSERSLLSRFTDLFRIGPAPVAAPPAPTQPLTPPQKQSVQPTPNIPVTVGKSFRPKIVVEERYPANQAPAEAKISMETITPTLKETQIQSQEAQFSSQAAPPLPPSLPNTITGQILDAEGKIIEGAILEIRDIAGRPVRALRSNKLGHFMIVTSLPNGQYDLITEKEGYEFEPLTFEAKGEIIPPILIRAKGINTTPSVPINTKPTSQNLVFP